MHVFIKHGLECAQKTFRSINLLEVGLGTGLNACLTFHSSSHEVNYLALEPYPLSVFEAEALRYDAFVAMEIFRRIHSAPFNEPVEFSPSFRFRKLKATLQDFEPAEKFHLIYFDAFAPTAQPELWTQEIFSKLSPWVEPEGVLVTYCAKGVVKRALTASGFMVHALSGAPGKREMIRAIKKQGNHAGCPV